MAPTPATAPPAPQNKKPPPPPPPARSGNAAAPSGTKVTFGKSSGARRQAERIGIYGPGGIGKSTLAALAPRPKFIDIEGGTSRLHVDRVELPEGVEWTFELVRQALQTEELWADADTVVIDTMTRLEELAKQHMYETVPVGQGKSAQRIEDYGYGKGFTILYDTFLPILGDLERLWRSGKHIVLLMHDTTNRVPNPEGEDWIRYEPRLSDPTSGKGSIRAVVREWLDHLLFIKYDVVTKDGKAKGHGSRTIYPAETPWAMAKSRDLADPFAFAHNQDNAIWAYFAQLAANQGAQP